MKKKFEIKHRVSSEIMFSLECESFKVCVETAIISRADLFCADLSGANLSGADLLGVNLSRANLSGADLSGADLSGVNLSWANLSGVNLSWANLSGADLSGADLSWVNLSWANLLGVNLSWANLSGADLSGADLLGVNLSGAGGKKTTIKYTPIQISGLRWPIIIFDDDMKIGCEYHSIQAWWSFTDKQISIMEDDALEFWNNNKHMLRLICDKNKRGVE